MTESPSTSGSCGLRTADDRARAAHRHRVDGLFSRDKKAIDGVTFVLDGPNGVETVVGVDPEVLAASFTAVR